MSRIVDLLRPIWLPRVSEVERVTAGGMQSWVRTGTYYLMDVASPRHVKLGLWDSLDLCQPFASEINRLASAAFETAASYRLIPRLPKSTAWLMIKMYYAAFYAAHALCRIGGKSSTNFTSDDFTAVNFLAGPWSGSSVETIESGFFSAQDRPSVELL